MGSSSPDSPERGLALPGDIKSPHDISEFEEYLDELENGGFPPSVSAFLLDHFAGPCDSNHDGLVDSVDLPDQQACFSGPGVPYATGCAVFDTDSDEDVDLADFAAFQSAFGYVQYLTEFQHEFGASVVSDAPAYTQPFFLILTVYASHDPSFPAPQDGDLFPDFTYRGRSWGEEDLSDKPWHVRDCADPRFTNYYAGTGCITWNCRHPDVFFGDQLRCQRAVDRMIGDLLAMVEQDQQLRDNTVFILASDNGEMWGGAQTVLERQGVRGIGARSTCHQDAQHGDRRHRRPGGGGS